MLRFLPYVGIIIYLIAGDTLAFSSPHLHHHHRRVVLTNSDCYANLPPLLRDDDRKLFSFAKTSSASISAILSISLLTVSPFIITSPVFAANDSGASIAANSKITTGGASTLQSGRTIAITRGVNLDNSNFNGKNLRGVAFQQSIVRDSDFRNANLVGASFFDATVDGSNFEGADMSLCNVEMAQFNRANLKNTIMREMYVSGSTLFEGVKDIEGSDWSETELRKDQKKYLCEHPTARGTNPVTGVATRESLMCLD